MSNTLRFQKMSKDTKSGKAARVSEALANLAIGLGRIFTYGSGHGNVQGGVFDEFDTKLSESRELIHDRQVLLVEKLRDTGFERALIQFKRFRIMQDELWDVFDEQQRTTMLTASRLHNIAETVPGRLSPMISCLSTSRL